MLSKKAKLEPLADIIPEIVKISNNYVPMPPNPMMMDCVFSTNNKAPKKLMSDEDLLEASFSSKANRTRVYSGNKVCRTDIPSLYEVCIRVLQENIDNLEYTGGIPFEILRPILERATADQLSILEYHNPYLLDESDVLWEPHCKRKFRIKQRQEDESWRDMYMVRLRLKISIAQM